MQQPPKKPAPQADSATDALWKQVGDLHKKLADLTVKVGAGEKHDPIQGAMASMAIADSVKAALEPLKAAIERATAKDEELTTELRALREVLEILASPRTRKGSVNLPGGPVEMTITEEHERKKGH